MRRWRRTALIDHDLTAHTKMHHCNRVCIEFEQQVLSSPINPNHSCSGETVSKFLTRGSTSDPFTTNRHLIETTADKGALKATADCFDFR
jgi:hypothetical protein